MKFNWGKGLVLAIILSSLGFILLVVLSSREQIDLVTEEYYPKGLVYEDEITKLKNTQSLSTPLQIELAESNIIFNFPEIADNPKAIEGEIWLYCPSDKYSDKNFEIRLDSAFQQTYPTKDLKAGRYKIIVDWQLGEKPFLQEEQIFINK